MSWNALTSETDELGESPFWHPTEQMLYWVDIQGKHIRRANIFMGTVQSWALPQEPGCIAPAASGGLVIALRDGIYRAQEWGGALTQICPAAHDPTTSRFNDGKADPLGRFWAGTIFEPRTSAAAALYAIDCRPDVALAGTPLQRMAGDATVANGLAWSPDTRTLYWTDTTRHLIQAWDWDANSNNMSAQRVFKQFPLKPAGWTYDSAGHLGTYGGRPDGAAVDVQGNYWVAMFEGARVLKLSPAGDILADIALPAQCPTMPCFGGDDLQTLYVTTARHGRSAKELADKPKSGCVFSMRVDVPGLPVNLFRD